MAKILRGDVFGADLDPAKGQEQSGHRPVVILSHDIFNERSGIVIACALTSQEQRAGFPLFLASGSFPGDAKLFVADGELLIKTLQRASVIFSFKC